VVARYVVVEGPSEGLDVPAFYSLWAEERPDGSINAPGIQEMKKAMTLVGKGLAAGYSFPTEAPEAAGLFGKRMQNVLLRIVLTYEPDRNDSTKSNSRVRVLGPATAATPASSQQYGDFDE